jgi:hypothetical protein
MISFRFCLARLTMVLAAAFLYPGKGYCQHTKFISSPEYHLDIGLNFTGQCSPYEGGATFSQYSAISSFNSIRFVGSQSDDYPCWIQEKGVPALFRVNGDGNIVTFQICPDFDPEPQEARVTFGPERFKPCLTVMDNHEVDEYLREGDSIPINPIAPSVWFSYSDCFRIVKPELQWVTDIGKGVAESRSVVFYISLKDLGKGEKIEIEREYQDGLEKGMWEITFIPN